MNNRMLYPVMLLVGVGIGTGVGMLISKPEIDKGQKEIDQLRAQIQISKTDSEERIQRATTEIARNKNELARMKNLVMQITTKLSTANAELKAIKGGEQTPPATAADTTQPQTVVMKTPTGTAPATSSIDYTVEENDSLWKIAEEQLGNGIRYQEIIDLNDGITENTVLHKGMKLKLPKE
jgi:nucleoid-associated protein YgaU